MNEELKRLLELAAKAAGIVGRFIEHLPEDGYPGYSCGIGNNVRDRLWNPIIDDGDALRLAVKLQIQVTPGTYNKDEFSAFKAGSCEAHKFRHYKQDEFAATRLAIVRAASAIGEAMP